jgi:hypothetical protein
VVIYGCSSPNTIVGRHAKDRSHQSKKQMTQFYTNTGFSIELIDYRLELRGEHEGLPLYEALDGNVTAIAIVDKPAIKAGAIAVSDSKIIKGPVMIPN